MKTIQVTTAKNCEFIDITDKIQKIATKENITKGVCTIFCPHTTAGLTINENADPLVKYDIINHLGKLVPEHNNFSHAEGNSDAHIKASLMGSSLNIIIEDGKLALGAWQGIYFCEFDGPRARKIYVEIINDK